MEYAFLEYKNGVCAESMKSLVEIEACSFGSSEYISSINK